MPTDLMAYEYPDFKLKHLDAFGGTILHPKESTLRGLENYVRDRQPPGGFLRAVLENDLAAAVRKADHENLRSLPYIAAYVIERLPGQCWGSRDAVAGWLRKETVDADC